MPIRPDLDTAAPNYFNAETAETARRNLLDSMFIFAGILTPDGVLVDANRTALEAANLAPAAVMHKPFADAYWWAYSSESQASLRDAIRRAAAGEFVRYDAVVRVAGGKFIDIDFAIAPVKDEAGRVLYLIPSGTDITDRKRTENALRESEQSFALATAAAEVGLWSLDLATNELSWSDLHKSMWGYEPSSRELYLDDWSARIHPDDLAYAIGQVEQALKEQKKYVAEYRIVRADDQTIRWMRSVGQYLYDAAGKAYRMTGITYDISQEHEMSQELAASEARFREILRAIPDGFMIFESVRDAKAAIVDFKWLYVNPAAEGIVGRTEADLVGKHLLVEMPGNKEAGLFDAYKQVVETGEVWQNEFSYQYEGLSHHFMTRALRIGDGFAVAFSDITARKNFEVALEKKVVERTAELQQLNAKLETTNRELEQFAFVSAHDLQEPLRKVEFFANLVQEQAADRLNEQDKKYLHKTVYSAQRMRNLIRDLLDYSKIKEDTELPKMPVNLNVCLREVLSIFEVSILQKKATIEVGELPTVWGVEWQITMLFTNLLANSLKFIRAHVPPVVRIQAQPATDSALQAVGLSADKPYACVLVMDNGIGFESAFSEKIFQMFQRLNNRSQYEGTGMGLALCAKIAAQHQGKIRAEGRLGEGAVFEIFLPMVVAAP